MLDAPLTNDQNGSNIPRGNQNGWLGGVKMRIDNHKFDLVLARNCKVISDLRDVTSPQTLTRIRRGENIKPATLGRIAAALGVDVTEILEEG